MSNWLGEWLYSWWNQTWRQYLIWYIYEFRQQWRIVQLRFLIIVIHKVCLLTLKREYLLVNMYNTVCNMNVVFYSSSSILKYNQYFVNIYCHTNVYLPRHATSFSILYWHTLQNKTPCQKMQRLYPQQKKNTRGLLVQLKTVDIFCSLNEKTTFQLHLLHDSYYQTSPSTAPNVTCSLILSRISKLIAFVYFFVKNRWTGKFDSICIITTVIWQWCGDAHCNCLCSN